MGIPCLLCVIVTNRKHPAPLFFYTWRFFFSKGVEQIITYLPMEVFDPAAVYFEASSRQPTTIRWLLISCVLPFPKSSFVAPVLNDQVTFDFPQCHHFQNSPDSVMVSVYSGWWLLLHLKTRVLNHPVQSNHTGEWDICLRRPTIFYLLFALAQKHLQISSLLFTT